MQTLPKAVQESMFQLTDFVIRTLVGFRKQFVYCESGFGKPLHKAPGGFQKAVHDNEYTFVLISSLLEGFSHS
jgi:hypothetical protein